MLANTIAPKIGKVVFAAFLKNHVWIEYCFYIVFFIMV